MNTRTSAAPASARSTSATCPASPTPASTNAGSSQASGHVLLPVRPVHSDAFLAGMSRTGTVTVSDPSEVVLQSRVREVAVRKTPHDIDVSSLEPADRAFERQIVPQLRRRDRAHERGPAPRRVPAEEAPLIFLADERPVSREDHRRVGPSACQCSHIAIISLVMHQHGSADPILTGFPIDTGADIGRTANADARSVGHLERIFDKDRPLGTESPLTTHCLHVSANYREPGKQTHGN